ncbi:MAG: hypothetical protein IJ180_09495 [Bacteroidales bacterium]|nr:hypothetical protein [Bacteroidales bacterium]
MRTYSITSDKLQGEILVTFDENDNLQNIDLTNANMTEGERNWFLANKPSTIEKLMTLKDKSKFNMKIELVPEKEITFEMFWQRYDDKYNSSKKRTKQKWDKMSKSEQAKAYNYINRYFSNIPYGTRKKYAETYLNAELWNN